MTGPLTPAEDMVAGPAGQVTATLSRGLRIAVVAITAGMLVGMCLPRMVAHLGSYASPAVQIGVYLVCLLVVATGAALALGNRSWGRWRWIAIMALLMSTVLSWRSLAEHPDPGDWHFGMVGWLGLIVLFDRSFLAIVAFLTCHVSLTAFLNLAVQHMDRTAVLGLANITVGVVGLQLAAAGAAGMLQGLAATAVAAARREEEATIRDRLARQLHVERLARYRELDEAVRPLLAGLASGDLDPADALVRRRCALEAARLRRLFAEADDVPDPLLHELEAAADVAQRRGVLVTMETTGAPVGVPRRIRRALTEPLLPGLTSARSWARIAVTRHDDTVSVSVIADVDEEVVLAGRGAESAAGDRVPVKVTSVREGGTWWVNCQWTRR